MTMTITAVSITVLKMFAVPFRLIDQPSGRKTHSHGTAMVGGLALMIGFLSVLVSNQSVFGDYLVVINFTVLLVIVGLLDDALSLTSSLRMMIQIGVGAGIYYLADLKFLSVGDIWFVGDLGLGPFALLFTIIAVVGGVNAVNMMDGADGLVGGLLLSTLSILWFLASDAGAVNMTEVLSLLVPALFVFLLFNYRFPWNPKARIFLGDSGAYALGFLVVVLFIEATQGADGFIPPILVLWIMAVPLIDIAGAIYRRAKIGKMPLADGREHVHYILLDAGFKHSLVINGLLITNMITGVLGVVLFYAGVSESVMFFLFMAICCAYFYFLSRIPENSQ
ncbi:MAG: hypothetical protein P8N51_07175 [Pseudomonadales bacterium]|nr:hypothetical protein [Pseudomonadales bacterium]